MAKMSCEELAKWARLSKIFIEVAERPYFANQLSSRLSYIDFVQNSTIGDVMVHQEGDELRMRMDTVVPSQSEILLEQAPQKEENFFIVPVVISHSK